MNEMFLNRMKEYLGDEYDSFVATLDQAMYKGLRVNTLKARAEDVLEELGIELVASNIAKDAYYLPADTKALGKTPYHLSGMFYLQEPSASSAVEVLDVKEGDYVLDMCAAPGGKSTQILTKLNHSGFVVSNEIDSKRAQALLSNMERFGSMEAMVTNTTPQAIAREFKGYFDKVLVDAPCSGEGMMKKHLLAADEWSIDNIMLCKTRQLDILDCAYDCLREDGILVYSTCTYAKEENEEVVAEFISKHQDMELLPITLNFGRHAYPRDDVDTTMCRRIFPMDDGEGHFVAKMQRKSKNVPPTIKTIPSCKIPKELEDFIQTYELKPYFYYIIENRVYIRNSSFINTEHVKVIRQGTYLGEIKKNRFEPQHHFFMNGYCMSSFPRVVDLNKDEVKLYLEGNVITKSVDKGYVAIRYKEAILGFGKSDGLQIKNHFPKGLRNHV